MKDLNKRFPVYSKFLKLYPGAYRKRYEQEMLQTTADMLDDAPSRSTKAAIWLNLAIDLPVNVSKQQLQYIGGIMLKDTPHYIKRNSIIATAMFLPFLAALTTNGLDKVINNHTLYNSWVWKSPAINLWIIWLPILAFWIAVLSYLNYVARSHSKSLRVKGIFGIKNAWPLVIPTVCALFIFFAIAFHDSVHCWVQSPSYLAHHFSQVKQCSERGRSFNTWHIVKRALF